MQVLQARIDQVQGNNWMSAIPDHLEFQHICMPGSHDAGMYLLKPPQDANFATKAAVSALIGLVVTQQLRVADQLQQGVRYFDFRPKFGESGTLYIHHGGYIGPELEEVMHDIIGFMQHYAGECLLLNFSHVEGLISNQHEEKYSNLKKSVQSVKEHGFDTALSKYLEGCPDDFTDELSALCEEAIRFFTQRTADFISMLWGHTMDFLPDQVVTRHTHFAELRAKVLIRLEHGLMMKVFEKKLDEIVEYMAVDPIFREKIKGMFVSINIYDDYSNKSRYEDMRNDQLDKFRHYNSHGKFSDHHDLFLLNWTLTPASSKKNFVIDAIVGSKDGMLKDYAAMVNPKIFYADEHAKAGNRNKLFSPNKAGRIVNIINTDFVLHPDILKTCFYVMENYDGRVRKLSHIRPSNKTDQRLDGHGESVYLHSVNDSDYQKWLIESVDFDQQTYRITSTATMRRLDGYLDRGPYLCDINSSDFQLWQMQPAENGQGVYLKSVQEHAYLSHTNGSLSLVTSTPSTTEVWQLEFAE
ncbi:MAG: hypothetical protein VXW65_03205 [Pseudomonadota bacterium]|nr:hypothetical protein [Pseudomonadota bacterium]